MHFIYTLIIALANNLDNISVRFAYSIRGIKISNLNNLWISIITFIISFLSASSVSMVSKYLNEMVASIISMLLLIAIGLWIIFEQYYNKNHISSDKNHYGILDILRKPEKADLDNSKDIDFKEATLLGIALSINNIGGGISAGMIGLSPIFVGFLTAVISFIAIWSGNFVSVFFNKWNLNTKSAIIAGITLIFLGIKQVI